MDIIEDRAETKKSFGLFFRIKLFFRYGLKLYKTNLDNLGSIIDWLQDSYYVRRKEEIISRLEFISKEMNKDRELLDNLSNTSMEYLKNCLAIRYSVYKNRKVFDNEDLWKNGADRYGGDRKKYCDVKTGCRVNS